MKLLTLKSINTLNKPRIMNTHMLLYNIHRNETCEISTKFRIDDICMMKPIPQGVEL